ncbi:hypothetical protein [Methylobacterium sp. Leaf125]|nr:hypothetical protein [Methylobacterium sp. Leaf125]
MLHPIRLLCLRLAARRETDPAMVVPRAAQYLAFLRTGAWAPIRSPYP